MKTKNFSIKKILKVILIILIILVVLFAASFIPTFWLKTSKMTLIEGKWVNVYYETEKDAAQVVFGLADSKAEEITKILGFTEKQPVNIYIYDNQYTMQTKKYGLIIPLLGLDWYIGDNKGTNVILTSPANPGRVHDYDNNKNACIHEMVHAYVSILNPKVKLWLTEGMALYLVNGYPFSKNILNSMSIPTYEDINTKNPIYFNDMGGYTFANTYIDMVGKKFLN